MPPEAEIRAPGEPRDSAALLAALYRIGSLVNSTEDPVEALRIILGEIVRALAASSASIALLNPDTGRLAIEVAHGHDAAAASVEIPIGRGVTGWVALHGRPLRVPDVRRDSRYFEIRAGVRSELAVPMEMLGQVVGVVNCDSDRVDAFSEGDQSFLALLTNEAAKVVGRLWLLRQLKEKTVQLEAIILAARALVHEREMPRVLSDLAEHTRQLARCRAAAVYFVENGVLRLAHLAGELGGSQLAASVSCDETSLGVAALRARQVEIPRTGLHEEFLFSRLENALAETSLLATPIVYDGGVLGVLLVIQGAPHRFSDEEKRLLATIASIGASALQNVRLYERVFSSEENLRRSERLNTLGLLAAEIAHEIRNPLTVIKLLFDTLNLNFPAGDVRGEDVRVIREKLSHLEAIVDRVLDYGRNRAVTFKAHDLGEVIAGTLLLLRLKFEQSRVSVSFEQDGADTLPAPRHLVSADKGQVQQVLVNLFFNAIEAMPDGGSINIRLWREAHRDGGERVCARVADTGGGIPDGLREQVFDSFLTGRREGNGLGLAIAKRIMRAHHGDIALESSGATGTAFVLWFPAG